MPWSGDHENQGHGHKATYNQNKQRTADMTFLKNFLKEEEGQDLIEYTLLMAFVALASAALFIGAGGSVKGIWSTTNSQLTAANTTAS
jgi:Flp pilus assembly pilin Flp